MTEWLIRAASDGPLPAIVVVFGADPAPLAPEAMTVRVEGGAFTARFRGQEQRGSVGGWCSVGGIRISAQPPAAEGGPVAAVDVVTQGAGGARTERVRLPAHEGGELIVGRDRSATDLQVSDAHVSRAHLRIRRDGGKYVLEDLGSRWGTKLNGRDVRTPVALADGDEVGFGKSKLVFVARGGDVAPPPRGRAMDYADTQATMQWQPPARS